MNHTEVKNIQALKENTAALRGEPKQGAGGVVAGGNGTPVGEAVWLSTDEGAARKVSIGANPSGTTTRRAELNRQKTD